MIELHAASLVLGVMLGGFGGCGLMAVRHMRDIGRIEGDYAARDKARAEREAKRDDEIRVLARRQSAYVQNTFGTDCEQEAREVGTGIFRLLDTLPPGGPHGR